MSAYVWAWVSSSGRVYPESLYAICDDCKVIIAGPYKTSDEAQPHVDRHNAKAHHAAAAPSTEGDPK